MERDGWIRRTTDTADRRKKLVEATAAARPAWKKITAAAQRVRSRATHGMTAPQLAQLKKLLSLVQRNLQEAAEQRAAG
jgi:DNA-binding MarR family transcriptional regulator